METIGDIGSVLTVLIAVGVVTGGVCSAILFAIKICVEKWLSGIKDELTEIKTMLVQHTTIHEVHKEKLKSHDKRISSLEYVVIKKAS